MDDVDLRTYLVFITFWELDIPAMSCLWYTEIDLEWNAYMKCHVWGILNCGFSEDVCTHSRLSNMYLVRMTFHKLDTLLQHSVWDIVIYTMFQELDILLKCCVRNIVIIYNIGLYFWIFMFVRCLTSWPILMKLGKNIMLWGNLQNNISLQSVIIIVADIKL